MKYTVIGSGAAGGIIGQILFAAGRQIEFVDSNSEHVAAIKDRELEIRNIHGPVRMPVKAYTTGNFSKEQGAIECAIICVRPEALKETISYILPRLSDDGIVINLSVNELPEGSGIPDRQLIQGVCVMDGDYLEPGLIHCGYLAGIYLGTGAAGNEAEEKLKQDLKEIPQFIFAADITSARWGAAAWLVMEAAGSVTHEAYQDAVLDDSIREIQGILKNEVLGLAEVLGADRKKAEEIIAEYTVCRQGSTKLRSGTWRDLAVRKRKTEAAILLDQLYRQGQAQGKNLWACLAFQELLDRLEKGWRDLESANIPWLIKEYEGYISGSLKAPQLRITIVGIGAIGSVIGAYLARGGTDVEFVDVNEAHVTAVNQRGLEIREQKKDHGAEAFIAKAKAYTPQQYLKRNVPVECILLCVKAQYTREALEQLLPVIDQDSFVVSVQNGITEFDIARIVGKERTVCGFVNIGADYIEPGLVHYGTRGPVAAGEWDGSYSKRIQRLEAAMKPADMFEISDNPMGYVWAKVAYSAITVVTTLTNEMTAVTIARPEYHEMMANLVTEVLSVAAAEHISLKGMAFDRFDPEAVYPRLGRDREAMLAMMKNHATIMKGTTKVHSGTWRDIVVRKKRAESHEHFRPIFELAEQYGIQMPMCRRLLEMLQEIEDGKRTFSDNNLDELLAMDLRVYPRGACKETPCGYT